MIEEWKVYRDTRTDDIRNTRGCLWEVSTFGRIKKNGQIYQPRIINSGYLSLSGGKLVHRIVFETYNGKIPKGYEIDHIDTNKTNNIITNLRLVTRKENMANPITKKKHKENQPDRKGEKNQMYGRRKIWNKEHTEFKWINIA